MPIAAPPPRRSLAISQLGQMHPAVLRGVMTAAMPQHAQRIQAMNSNELGQLAQSVSTIAPPVARSLAAPSPENNETVQKTASQLAFGQLAAQAAATLLATGEGAKWGRTGAMNPLASVMRRETQPVKLLPGNCTTNASGVGSITFAPQEPFEGFRLVVASNQGAGFISQITAGDRLMTAQSGRIPFSCLSEKSDVGRIDFPLISLGETIVMQVSGATANTEICATIIGYGTRPRVLPTGAEVLYQRYEPFDVTSEPAANTGTITLQPQRHCIIRRLAFDDTVANFASLYVTSLNVQDIPQFVGNVEIPAQVFSELAVDDWLDFDLCQLGGTITIGVRNANANANFPVLCQGVAEVDIVRLPGEPRR